MHKFVRDRIQVGLASIILQKLKPFSYIDSWYAQSFNGQIRRTQNIVEICETFEPTVIIETGTFLGSSTVALARLTNGPVHTIEVNEKFAEKAKERFNKNHNNNKIEMHVGDSSQHISKILSDIDPTKSRVFAYLDAHWEKSVPTETELRILTQWNGAWIAVIDDFQNPVHKDYGFDKYGDLSICIDLVPKSKNVQVWVSNIPSEYETGARRGTAYVFSRLALKKFSHAQFRNLVRIL